jgi:hypothetical protein
VGRDLAGGVRRGSLYGHAAARDPTVAGRYPALEAYLRLRRDLAARGQATRAKKRRQAPPNAA